MTKPIPIKKLNKIEILFKMLLFITVEKHYVKSSLQKRRKPP
jgi:hypothetical protein